MQVFECFFFNYVFIIIYRSTIIKKYVTGDLYDGQQLLSWLLTQKNPAGDVIEAYEGQELLDLIEESPSIAVYFCKSFSINLADTHLK